jgi:hypothetical protein
MITNQLLYQLSYTGLGGMTQWVAANGDSSKTVSGEANVKSVGSPEG